MDGFDFAKKLINQTINDVKKEVKDGLKFCGLIDEEPQKFQEQPIQDIPAEEKPIIEVPKENKPDCPYGRCCEYDDGFYYTCEKSVSCPRGLKKQHYDCLQTLENKEILDFIIRYSSNKIIGYNEYNLEMYYLNEYADTFFPNLKFLKSFIVECLRWSTSSLNPNLSPFTQFLFELNDKKLSYPNLASNLKHLYGIYKEQRYGEREKVIVSLLKTPSVLLRDPTLFARDFEDFKYSYGTIELFSDKKGLSEYLKDHTKVNVDMLFNDDGTLKPAGIGGPEIGETADGIWSLVDKISHSDNAKDSDE